MRIICVNLDDPYAQGHIKIGNFYTVVGEYTPVGEYNHSLVTIMVNGSPWSFERSCFITMEENRDLVIDSILN